MTVLEATVRLSRAAVHGSLLVLGYPDVYAAADTGPESSPAADRPGGIDQVMVDGTCAATGLHADDLSLLPDGPGGSWSSSAATTAMRRRPGSRR